MYDPLGLSIGSTNLVAACNGSTPVTRRAVLTLYPHCAPKVGVPTDHSDSDLKLSEPGTTMSGFVGRIGDSVALVSADGSTHDPNLLMVEALDAMVCAAGADSSSSEISIAVPAYWKPGTVQALRDALRTHIGFVRSGMAPRLVPDSLAAMNAVNAELGIPVGGVVGLLDFGGSGTYVTLMDTGSDFEPVSATMRYLDFSGAEIDQALLLHVFEQVGHRGNVDPASTTGIGQLSQLREQCREAKERLSTDTATELAVELPGCSTTIQVTRAQLDDLIQDRLTAFIYAFDDMLARNKTSWTDLTTVVTVGGGASIPLVRQRLSLHTRRPILTAKLPAATAATGALLLAGRGECIDYRTKSSLGLLAAHAGGTGIIELPAGDVMVIDQDAMTDRELAWSQTEYGDVPVLLTRDSFDEEAPCWSMRLNLLEPAKELPPRRRRRVRVSQVLIGLCAVVAMTAIGGVAITLTAIENHEAPVVPSVAPLPAPPPSLQPSAPVPTIVPPPPSAVPAPSAQVVPSVEPPPPPPPSIPPAPHPQPPRVMTTPKPPPPPVTTTTQPPPPVETATTPTSTPPPPPAQTSTSTPVPMTTQWIHVPLLPVPIPVPVPANQAPQVPQNPQYQPAQPQNPFAPGNR